MYSSLYPEYYTAEMQTSLSAFVGTGKRFADCIGLVKGYFWYNGNDVIPDFSIFPDTSAQDLYRNASRKGAISTLPDIPGIVLYDANVPHIGIYVGNGMAIDDRTFSQGTIYSNVSSYTWTNWIMLDELDYDSYESNIDNTSALFGRQINSLQTVLSFLPSDITAALIVILVFIFALGIARIVL